MNTGGINLGFWLVQVFNLLILIAWPGLALLTLFALRGRRLAQTAQVMWVLILLLVPLMGPLAFWIVRPGERAPEPPATSGLTTSRDVVKP